MRKIQMISGIISLFFGIFAIAFFFILPLMGVYFDYNSIGTSMEPALTDAVDIRLGPEWVPFEEIQVGDIILFRQEDYRGNNRPPGKVYVPEWNNDHTGFRLVPQAELEEPPKYIHVLHRIIAIKEDGLVTKGDKNKYHDFLIVKSEEYEGKLVWRMNYINWLFKAMYRYGVWMGCVILFFVSSFYSRRDLKASDVFPTDATICE